MPILIRLNFNDLDRERLFKQTIVVRIVHSINEPAQSCWTINSQRLRARSSLRRPFRAPKKRRQSADVIEMKMTDPDGVEIRPVELFLGHTVRRIDAAVEQHCAFRRFKPMRGRRTSRVWTCGARTEDR